MIRLVVKTQPLQQWAVARELRRRIKDRFDAEGIHVAHPQSAVWVAGDAPAADATRRGGRGSAAPDARAVNAAPQASTRTRTVSGSSWSSADDVPRVVDAGCRSPRSRPAAGGQRLVPRR